MHVASHDLFNMKLRTCLDTGMSFSWKMVALCAFSRNSGEYILSIPFLSFMVLSYQSSHLRSHEPNTV